jgi:tetratricopeptide (TPR) repeat protein
MKPHLLLPLLLLGAAVPAPAQDKEGRAIVVTGTRLSDTERRLRECVARRCPPKEDIDATLAHVENLFVAGDYEEARRVARRGIGRNDGHAKAHPVEVSDLYRAYSRVNAHLGDGEPYRRATYAIRRTLKEGLPEDDPRILGASFEVAGMYASMKEFDRARRAYEEIEDKAARLGRPDLAANARVRAAWLHELAGYRELARPALRKVAEDAAPEARLARLTALILLARIDRQEGKKASSDALIESLKGKVGARPVMLFAPRIEMDRGIDPTAGGSVTRLLAGDNYRDRWVDIGFWVTPEGRVSDVEVLRSGSRHEHWTGPLLRSIEGRIYSPPADPAGSYRVERYTLTALLMTVTGTRLEQRSPESRIEYVDLTAEPPRAAARP